MEQQKDSQKKTFTNIGQSVVGVPNSRTTIVQATESKTERRSDSTNREMGKAQNIQSVRGFGYLIRKAEKLTTALYLVTDIMSEREPIKWKARESAVELLSDITLAASLSVSEKMTMLRNAMKKTEKAIAFLDIAQSAHLISEMNASVLKREYLALKDGIEGEWSHVYEKSRSIFSDSFFDVSHESAPELLSGGPVQGVPAPATKLDGAERHGIIHVPGAYRTPEPREAGNIRTQPPLPVPTEQGEHVGPTRPSASKEVTTPVSVQRPPLPMTMEKKQLPMVSPPRLITTPDQVSIPAAVSSIPSMGHKDSQNRNVSDPDHSPRASTPAVQNRDPLLRARNDIDHTDRRKIILALIKQKPALTVKDIGRSIPHVSEKTIQRELLSMVTEGILLKRGERRWSTYSLR